MTSKKARPINPTEVDALFPIFEAVYNSKEPVVIRFDTPGKAWHFRTDMYEFRQRYRNEKQPNWQMLECIKISHTRGSRVLTMYAYNPLASFVRAQMKISDAPIPRTPEEHAEYERRSSGVVAQPLPAFDLNEFLALGSGGPVVEPDVRASVPGEDFDLPTADEPAKE